MLSPSNRVVLLPCDREIMELAGLTEAEYREFVRQCRFESKIRPGMPTAIEPTTLAIISIVLGAALYAAGTLLAPKPKTQSTKQVRLQGSNKQGLNIISGARYAPKAGFDSLQNVVELASTVPLVYSRREIVNGVSYGGVRINTNLLWSQVKSLGGDQLLRAILLVGEGDNRADSMEIDATQCAFGNNLLGSYDLADNSANPNARSRITLYYSNDGGRIVDGDYLAGNPAGSDEGNSQTGDVFAVRGANGLYGANFSYAEKPSTQTSIGLFSWLANGMGYKVNPVLRPRYRPGSRVLGNGNTRIVCDEDPQEKLARDKQEARYSHNSGITSGNAALAVGALVKYELDSAIAQTGFLTYTATGNVAGTTTAELNYEDVNSAVASRQTAFDEAIVIGELYKIGSAIAICVDRSDASFQSAADGTAQSTFGTFQVVRAGAMTAAPGLDGTGNATNTSQIFRLARGTFVTQYPCQVVEIGLRSTVGISVNGLTNVIEKSGTDDLDYEYIDALSCPAPPAIAWGPFP